MSELILVKSLDNKILNDPITGTTIHPFRPTIVPDSIFIERKARGSSEYLGKEVEVLAIKVEPSLTDSKFEAVYREKVKGMKYEDERTEIIEELVEAVKSKKFIKTYMKKTSDSSKSTKVLETNKKPEPSSEIAAETAAVRSTGFSS